MRLICTRTVRARAFGGKEAWLGCCIDEAAMQRRTCGGLHARHGGTKRAWA
jgi:hypothetical protein